MYNKHSVAAGLGLVLVATTAAPAEAAIDNREPGPFIHSLATAGFTVLKGSKASARSQFRSLLARHFAVEAIGDRLIRRWRPTISQSQYAAYKAAFPDFIIGTYADRLYDYADANFKVIRVQEQANGAAVLTQVTKPGTRPISAVWSVTKINGSYKVTNLTVAGINLAVAQSADFDSYVQRNGFDALLTFMKKRG